MGKTDRDAKRKRGKQSNTIAPGQVIMMKDSPICLLLRYQLLMVWLKQVSDPKRSAAESGLSMLEVLATTVMAAVIIAATLPVLLLSASTRLQTYRTEQALAIAQGEIDRVRTLMTEGVKVSNEANSLPPNYGGSALTGSLETTVAAPSALSTDPEATGSFTEAQPIDVDEDGQADYIMQTFRDEGARFVVGSRAGGELALFNMGVRVYDAIAIENLGSLSTEPISLSVVQGIGQRDTNPLAVVQTEMSRSDIEGSLQQYIDFLQ